MTTDQTTTTTDGAPAEATIIHTPDCQPGPMRVTPTATRVWHLLRSHAERTNARPTLPVLAAGAGVCVSTVRQAMRELEAAGAIVRKEGTGRGRGHPARYTVSPHPTPTPTSIPGRDPMTTTLEADAATNPAPAPALAEPAETALLDSLVREMVARFLTDTATNAIDAGDCVFAAALLRHALDGLAHLPHHLTAAAPADPTEGAQE